MHGLRHGLDPLPSAVLTGAANEEQILMGFGRCHSDCGWGKHVRGRSLAPAVGGEPYRFAIESFRCPLGQLSNIMEPLILYTLCEAANMIRA